ncbi:hypothetical protein H6F67_21565 [Microcoleus sp. FACHB-1515]|uniref:calcium-binding protein n=1 Tax=Cyanophyceae TaxID=3028117 RepID=UPI0016849A6E|nr:hypothetical protein [Microcoleus sp. FACHB-1515]MBD2092439.1 hypothetical protein [Microcoleus sp. FACHB-1515]
MNGGQGNDTYLIDYAGDRIVEQANQGIDTVRSTVSWVLSANLENLVLSSTNNINATGNALDNTLVGNAGNNILSGGGHDLLNGGAGNDILQSSGGAAGEIDTLTGNSGADLFILGTTAGALYNDTHSATAGTGDYALITDFSAIEDLIQLHGWQTDYTLAASPTGLPTGTAIYRVVPTGQLNELIAILGNRTIATVPFLRINSILSTN